MIQHLINEQEVMRTWAPIIESSTGITDRSKLNWMSKYAHYHKLYEDAHNVVHLNPNMNVYGMGAVTLPGDPTSITGFSSQVPGSGDKPYSLLPIAMQVSAQTVGLDLVAVVPMPGPMGMLTYLDFNYAGGRLDTRESPLMIKVPTQYGTITGFAFTEGVDYYVKSGNAATTVDYIFTYIGDSRIDGYPIFRVTPTDATGAALPYGTIAKKTINEAVLSDRIFAAPTDLFADPGAIFVPGERAELVKALEDHISGFSGRAMRLSTGIGNAPYSRGEGESEPANLMGLTLFNKSVEAKTVNVAATVTIEQVQDLKQYGIDAIAQIESVLTNELTQSINKLILERLFQLGATNHTRAFATNGVNLNLNFGTVSVNIALGLGEDGLAVPVMATAAEAFLGGETRGTLQRRILSKILAASNLIAIRGRRGAATFVVTNGQVASAIQDIAGFVAYPLSNTINQTAGSLYPIGAISGMNVYVDPNMDWDDTRVCVGRKGDGNSTGLVFMPYLMAESVQTVTEGLMSPKILVKSRFALVDAGHHPETNYIVLMVAVGANAPTLV